ncbi:MAG: translation initiation factor IF-2 [Alphaproteobacteria bacterium]|nr:translation initiation factor IF-2 [Alphaproteobacteria bacterium]
MNEKDHKLSLPPRGRLELKKTVDGGQVRQSFSHGRSKVVSVEVRKKRSYTPTNAPHPDSRGDQFPEGATHEEMLAHLEAASDLTAQEKAHRLRALQEARKADEDAARHRQEEAENVPATAVEPSPESLPPVSEGPLPVAQEAAEEVPEPIPAPIVEASAPVPQPVSVSPPGLAATPSAPAVPAAPVVPVAIAVPAAPTVPAAPVVPVAIAVPAANGAAVKASPSAAAVVPEDDESSDRKKGPGRVAPVKVPSKRSEPRRRAGKLTITAALEGDDRSERGRSIAALRRAQEKERRKLQLQQKSLEKVVREVVIPETITVQELANRMAERGANVIKVLMRMGVMATINQVIDADTAELVVAEFGHHFKRVADADVEEGLIGEEDAGELLRSRPPVVTIMGHVDHGKTSLLDALRQTDVVSGEAGGITQHIGAYQVTMPTGGKITFIDTPGHEAFTSMRARGAKVTDIVVLVVAADDGIMPQTVEAIRHARAADVPIIVAINKIDKPDADPEQVRNGLLQHSIVLETHGGDVLSVEVSAKKKINLDRLEETILLQSEILDLRANPERPAEGTVIEARMEKGRGSVATILVQRGTLRTGDVFVAGKEWGRVRALLDDRGNRVEEAGPSMPVEILGFQSTPDAGDDFVVVGDETKAREVAGYRQRKQREALHVQSARGTLEQMFARIQAGEAKELPVVIKGDVQGSVEALIGTLEKLGSAEVKVRVLHAAVGGINESDVTLAKASGALIIGFNVRANPQAREMARRDGVDIRYYSIIYNVADDMRQALSGMLEPVYREKFLGNAEVRQVFSITKVGKVAGCMVTEGVVKRGAKVRLLRDNVVIHEGKLGELKRFKEDAREVRAGFDCGMSFETYHDILAGDVIECFELEEVAATL